MFLDSLTLPFAPIPGSDDRFARQKRCGPPPEFPLASSWPGIGHHLSGPNMCALGAPARTPASRRPSQTPRGCAAATADPEGAIKRRISPQRAQRQAFAFTAPWCLVAPRLAHMLDSLIRVTRRVGWNHNQTRRKLERAPQNRRRRQGPAPGTHDRERRALRPHRTPRNSCRRRCSPRPRASAASIGRARARRTTLGWQTTAHPKGLKQDAPRRTRPAPTCRPHQLRRGPDLNRQGSTTPGPHESLSVKIPRGCDVLLEEPYERPRWPINDGRQRRTAAIDPEGDRRMHRRPPSCDRPERAP